MNTKDAAAKIDVLKTSALALLKRDPKRSAIVIGSTVAAIAVLSADDDGTGGGFGFGFGGGWETHEIIDANGPGGKMVAATVETPSGWSLSGGVNWHNPNDATDPYKFGFTAVSGDGTQRVEYLPQQSWATGRGAAGFARTGNETTAEGVVKRLFIPKLRPGATVLGTETNSKAVAELRSQVQATVGRMPGNRAGVDAVAVAIEYDENGKRYQETLISLLQWTRSEGTQGEHSMMAQMGMGYSSSQFNVSQIMTMRAPAGEMESASPTLEKVLDSIKRTEQWQSTVAKYHRGESQRQFAQSRTRLQSSQEAHNTRMAGNRAAFEASQATYHSTQASNDAANRDWLNAHLGQADFYSPHSGQVETHSYNGGRMWQDNSGNTFSTETWQDDPRMAPGNWGRGVQEMQQFRW